MDDGFKIALQRIEEAAETEAEELNLAELGLSTEQLTTLMPKLIPLTNLQHLELQDNRMDAFPPELGQLVQLQTLNLVRNQLQTIPSELGQLVNLRQLDLRENQLTFLPSELGQLSKLEILDLQTNKLQNLPVELRQLTHLKTFLISGNQIQTILPEIMQLKNLEALVLTDGQLQSIPLELTQFTNLKILALSGNELRSVPSEIGLLANLLAFFVDDNQIQILPSEIGKLNNLIRLNLENNQLRSIPWEMGYLSNLTYLELSNNPDLKSPPQEIIAQGAKAVVTYLRELIPGFAREWMSKLIVVGEGGVGKTSLLRRLRDEAFIAGEDTTHGIAIQPLELAHPEQPETMVLNAWDFGGQEIYHATHQFFLTNRSLFLVAWNTRLGYEQGKLYYWLDTIKNLAPDAPILLVATHIDERFADLPLAEIMNQYPQVRGQVEISSKANAGFDDLRAQICTLSAALPLMGEIYPITWLAAAEAVRGSDQRHVTEAELFAMMAEHGVVEATSQKVLARWMHELGDILYFPDVAELCDTVILKPQWVSKHISQVLTDERVIETRGIFTRQQMNLVWSDLRPDMREHFLHMMEQFDLSYRIPEDPENKSLVVERLSYDEADYQERWAAARQQEGCNEVRMRFELDSTMPAGIPTWFIARQHRFTQNVHWRYGVLFGDDRHTPTHLGLVRAVPHDRYIDLTVRGPNPYNFFALLRDGLEVTLARFPGLKVNRLIPCPGHGGEACPYKFRLENLLRAQEKGRTDVECGVSFERVSVLELLYGFDYPTSEAKIIERIDELEQGDIQRHEELLNEMQESRTLMQREFSNIYYRDQAYEESHTPYVFTLMPVQTGRWNPKRLLGENVKLHLWCQAPGCWHPTEKDGEYVIAQPAKWLAGIAPHLKTLVKYLKYATPLVGPWLGVALPDYEEMFKTQIDLTEELVKKLPEIEAPEGSEWAEGIREMEQPERIEGANLRALRQLLDEIDPTQKWGGLMKTLTPEGHYLWLCAYHHDQYRAPFQH